MANSIGIRPRARLDVVESRRPEQAERSSGNAYRVRLDAGTARTCSGLRLAFYLERHNAIEIVRVVHGARDLDVVLRSE